MAFLQKRLLKKQKNFCGSKFIKLLSPAKINLYLNILGKYPQGYHCIESIVERISLCDEIILELRDSSQIKIISNVKALENEDNLCVKAARLLINQFNLPLGVNIFLKKNIPIGAGLGGGSSNAAFTLSGLNILFDLNLTKENLYSLGERLGSDVNFFLSQNKFALIQGRGEKVLPLEGGNFCHFVIWPGVHLSTGEVYQNTRVKLTKFFSNVKILQYALRKEDVFLLKKNLFNVLEKSALLLCKEMAEIKKYLDKKDIFCRVTGSGSALYTISNRGSYREMKHIFSKRWTVFEVQTF